MNSAAANRRGSIAQLMTQPADVLLLDEPTNDLDIPALDVLEESLHGVSGAAVIVSHDRDLLDWLCTQVIGLDGRGGGSGLLLSVSQWLNAYQQADAIVAPKPETPRRVTPSLTAKPRKLSFREQQEWDQMESLILAAEEEVAARHRAVEHAARQGHVALADACHALEAADARWRPTTPDGRNWKPAVRAI